MRWHRRPRTGDWVEVRSKDEILRTLDRHGELEGMPFMPEMFAFCGKRFQVYKRAHKTCDTVHPVRGRRVADAVHLDTRCDGSAHDGCQAGCLLFWKLAWLKPLDGNVERRAETVPTGCVESDVYARTRSVDPKDGQPRYTCQATQLPEASTDLDWWDLSQYVEDYTSGNVGLGRILSGTIYMAAYWVSRAGIGLGKPIRSIWNTCYPLWGGTPFPRQPGKIPEGQPTPVVALNLQPGELVQVKSHEKILDTLNTHSRNRGLFWDAEELPYCGKSYRVLKRVERIIVDKTGKMQEMKTPCVILDSVICQSRYSEHRLFCPRSIYPYWREIWLERVADGPHDGTNRLEGRS